MLTKMHRILCLAAAVASLAAFTLSCAETGGMVSDQLSLTSVTPESETTSATEEKLEIPESDFKGYEFRVFSRGRAVKGDWYSRDLTVAEQNGDVLNDAIYQRNQTVEELLNIKFTELDGAWNACLAPARASLLAGEDAYDLLVLGPAMELAPLQSEKLLLNISDVPYIDLEKSWWDDRSVRDLSLDGKVYAVVGDLTYVDKDATWAILFTRGMVENYKLDDPYQLVRGGKWTFDAVGAMMKKVSNDVNGDGRMDHLDSFGMVGQAAGSYALLNGFGLGVFTKDKSDVPQLAANSPAYSTALEKVITLLADKNVSTIEEHAKQWGSPYKDTFYDMFGSMMEDNRALFYLTVLNRVTKLRELESDFGILPLPLYTEAQDEFVTPISTIAGNAISVPVTAKKPERTGIVVEAWCANSTDTVRNAYYEVTLKTKLTRDEESAEMLDIIFSTRCYDLGEMYDWGKLYSTVVSMTTVGDTAFAAKLAASEQTAFAEMKAFIELQKK